jgi:hypothetical protein
VWEGILPLFLFSKRGGNDVRTRGHERGTPLLCIADQKRFVEKKEIASPCALFFRSCSSFVGALPFFKGTRPAHNQDLGGVQQPPFAL